MASSAPLLDEKRQSSGLPLSVQRHDRFVFCCTLGASPPEHCDYSRRTRLWICAVLFVVIFVSCVVDLSYLSFLAHQSTSASSRELNPVFFGLYEAIDFSAAMVTISMLVYDPNRLALKFRSALAAGDHADWSQTNRRIFFVLVLSVVMLARPIMTVYGYASFHSDRFPLRDALLAVWGGFLKKQLSVVFVSVYAARCILLRAMADNLCTVLQTDLQHLGSSSAIWTRASSMLLEYHSAVQRWNVWWGRTGGVIFFLFSSELFFSTFQAATHYNTNELVAVNLGYVIVDIFTVLPLLLVPPALVSAAIDNILVAANGYMTTGVDRDANNRRSQDVAVSMDVKSAAHWTDTSAHREHVEFQTFVARVHSLPLQATVLSVPMTFSLVGKLLYLGLTAILVVLRATSRTSVGE